MTSAKQVHVHPPKVEVFDTLARTNTDPKGFVRPVDVYEAHPWGLYMARPADHRQFNYVESWLLPDLGLRATIFHFVPEHRRDQDRYVDVGEYVSDGTVWRSTDHYLDIVVRTGRGQELLDVDELFGAVRAGLVSDDVAEAAVSRAADALDGIAAAGHDLDAWLHGRGMPVTWR